MSAGAVVAAVGVLAAESAGAGPKPIRSCSTTALKSAVAAGGSWVFKCSGTITAPKPENRPVLQLGKGFEVKKSLILDVAQGQNVTLQTGQTSLPDNSTEAWRIFTVAPGVTLTLRDLTLSGNAPAPEGQSDTADTSGAPGADGGPGVSGDKGVDGGLGSPGGPGGVAQGGAIFNQGTVNLFSDEFDGVNALGGKGGNGSNGGNGGDGGGGGEADPGPTQTCQEQGGGSVDYTAEGGPGGNGGDGGETGVGMAGGIGGTAEGGAIYNQGRLTVNDTTFQGDTAQGGLGGDGGKGGDGGGGGDGADGYGAGDGGDGGHGADGAPAASGGAGEGGAIYNVGTAALFNARFTSDVAEGGNSGNGGDGGKGGDGGGGGDGLTFGSCVSGGVKDDNPTPGGDGGNGGGGSNGGKGSGGGTALGGAIFNQGHLSLFDTSFKQDSLTVGLGSQPVASCGGNQSVPCVGKGGQGGNGGDGGTDGGGGDEASGLMGASGTDGMIGSNGPAFGKDVYGQKPLNVTTDGKASGGRISSAPQGAKVAVRCKGKPSQACVLVYELAIIEPGGHAIGLGNGRLILLGGEATVWQLTLDQTGQALLQHVRHTHVHVAVSQLNGRRRRQVAAGDITL